jgi:hypothetical protein
LIAFSNKGGANFIANLLGGRLPSEKYLQSHFSKLPNVIVLATGFDDGDLYNFCKKKKEK